MERSIDMQIYRSKSLRLPGYDYSQSGAYFITVCIDGRRHLLGEMTDGFLEPNEYGLAVEYWWRRIPEKYVQAEIDRYIVMPNHFHGILWIRRSETERGHPHGGVPTLGGMVGWFKARSTNVAIDIAKRDHVVLGPFWQRNYYERIIRNDEELNRIRRYILENPERWEEDPENLNVLNLDMPRTPECWSG
jgi:putative transposase